MNSAIAVLTLLVSINYSGSFEEGDWVTYTNFRYVTCAATDQSIVYFGTTGGVIRYDKYTGQWLDPLTITDGIPDSRIENIAYDPEWNRIWVSTPAGDAYYDPTFRQWYDDIDFPIQLARNDYHPGNFGILNTSFGWYYQDGYLIDRNFQKYQLTRGISDDFDHLFAGTWGYGPVVINTRYKDLEMIPYGPYNDNVTTIVNIGNEFWLGDGEGDLSSGALNMLDINTGKWRWFQPRYTDGLASAKLTGGWGNKETVWLGTMYGLARYDKKKDYFVTFADNSSLPSLEVLSVAEDRKYIFTGTANGIGYIDKQSKKDNSREKRSNKQDFEEDKSVKGSARLKRERFLGWRINDLKMLGDYIYVASDRGVLRGNVKTGINYEYLDTQDEKLSTEILEININGDSLYFLTPNDIVIINIKDEESSVVTDPSYFPNWRLRNLATDGINIWAATDIGLWKYRIADGYTRLYTAGDGMISDDIRDVVLNGDYIWIATPRGLIRFYWNDPGRVD